MTLPEPTAGETPEWWELELWWLGGERLPPGFDAQLRTFDDMLADLAAANRRECGSGRGET